MWWNRNELKINSSFRFSIKINYQKNKLKRFKELLENKGNFKNYDSPGI